MATTTINKNRKKQIAEFIDSDHDVMRKFYDLTEKRLSRSVLIAKMQKLIETDKDFYDPYLVIAEELYIQDKNEDANALIKEAYVRAVTRISDSQGRWPKAMLWGFLENRHLMRALEYYADMCWDNGNIDEALDVYRRLLKVNPADNQGARYNILAIRMGLGPDEWSQPFEVKEKGKIIGLDAMKTHDWFHKNAQKFPDDFDWFIKFHEDNT